MDAPSGCTGNARNIDSHDPAEQTHKVMQSIRQLIEEADGTMAHLVKVVVYITDVRHREAVNRTMGDYIKGVHPVSTGLVVQLPGIPARVCGPGYMNQGHIPDEWIDAAQLTACDRMPAQLHSGT